MSIMVFGVFAAVGSRRYGELCIVPTGSDGSTDARTYHQVLMDFVDPFMATLPEGYFLVEDNASCHRGTGVYPMPFGRLKHGQYPAHSPDFNAIERLWAATEASVKAAIWNEGPLTVLQARAAICTAFQAMVQGPAGERAIEWAWNNVVYGAANNGEQRPTP